MEIEHDGAAVSLTDRSGPADCKMSVEKEDKS